MEENKVGLCKSLFANWTIFTENLQKECSTPIGCKIFKVGLIVFIYFLICLAWSMDISSP